MNLSQESLMESSNKELRNQYISRLDILDKVKDLVEMPLTQLSTIEQVAEYYEIDIRHVKRLLASNRQEFEEDGYKIYNLNDFKSDMDSIIKNASATRGKFTIMFKNGLEYNFSPRGVGLFTRRAVLRTGMLLKESKVAYRVRTALLDIEEVTSIEVKTYEIDKEKQLVLDIVYAKDDIETATATRNLLEYKNRHITELENENKSLAEGIVTWDYRATINKMVRKIAYKEFNGIVGYAWNKLKDEMLYKHGINITTRQTKSDKTKPTMFDVINAEELKLAVKTCVALCKTYGIDTTDIFGLDEVK